MAHTRRHRHTPTALTEAAPKRHRTAEVRASFVHARHPPSLACQVRIMIIFRYFASFVVRLVHARKLDEVDNVGDNVAGVKPPMIILGRFAFMLALAITDIITRRLVVRLATETVSRFSYSVVNIHSSAHCFLMFAVVLRTHTHTTRFEQECKQEASANGRTCKSYRNPDGIRSAVSERNFAPPLCVYGGGLQVRRQ